MEVRPGQYPLRRRQGRRRRRPGAATGRGVSLMVREWARTANAHLDQLNVVVQGFGNVGGVAARLLDEMGCRVIAVSEASGGYVRRGGLDIAAMQQYAAKHPKR